MKVINLSKLENCYPNPFGRPHKGNSTCSTQPSHSKTSNLRPAISLRNSREAEKDNTAFELMTSTAYVFTGTTDPSKKLK